MRECLNCKKEYEHKREASKFCSGKCRVKYNRDNPKDKITKVQMQVLYNAMMEKLDGLSKIQYAPATPAAYVGTKRNIEDDGPLRFSAPPKALKSFEQYKQMKREIELEEDWEKLKAEIDAAPNLSDKQKNLLKTIL